MRIINRIKDSGGALLGYNVEIEKQIQFLTPLDCVRFESMIDNAYCLNKEKGIFRAKCGYVIPTEVRDFNYKDASPLINTSQVQVTNNNLPIKRVDLSDKVLGKDFVNICRKLRQAIRLGKVIVDKSTHNSNGGLNTQYFKFIQACGFTIDDFVLHYLYNVQPCALRRHLTMKKTTDLDLIILIDTGYCVNLYIKIRKDNSVVVSFHDDNTKGNANKIAEKFLDTKYDYAYILLNEACSYTDSFVPFYMSRGFSTFRFVLNSEVVAPDLIKVSTKQLSQELKSQIDVLITDAFKIEDVGLPMSFDSSLQGHTKDVSSGLNFGSIGANTLSVISLLIDLFSQTSSKIERETILTMLGSIVESEILPLDRPVYLDALNDAFKLRKTNAALTYTREVLQGSITQPKLGNI